MLDRDKRKTQVSTCVNFIHQKDAYIAMKVVDTFTKKNQNLSIPIYTVHDNFITTSIYTKLLPECYTSVFSEMGPPLRIINEFIQLNLIPERMLWKKKVYQWFNEPIPGHSLMSLLINLEPDNLSLKDKTNFDKKVDEIVSCYEEYVNAVCGEVLTPDGGMRHEEKWNEFSSLLDSWKRLDHNYSLHY